MRTLIFLLAALSVNAQTNFAVRFLSMDAAHEFNATPGCPTNWPVVVDNIGTNAVSPFPNRAVLSSSGLLSVYAAAGPTFTNWFNNTWRPFAAQRETTDVLTRSNNIALLKSIYADMATYEQRWQAGLSATTTAQINTVISNHNVFLLRLKPVLQELYRGE